MAFDNDEVLLSPFTLGDLKLKNRVILAPLTRGRAGEERLANELMAEYYSQRSGAGLIISEATTVSAQGNGWVNSPGIYTDAQGEGWKTVTNAVHKAGSKIFLQLWHTGRASHSDFHGGELPVAPSAIKIEGEGLHTPKGKVLHEIPRALRTDEIPGVVADYKKAAIRAKQAGFDGVEVHSANGYLLDQFLQSKTNKRTDQYGGSLENRFRLLSEILDAVSEVYPSGRIGVRLAPNGVFNDMGSLDYRETFTYAATRLNDYGLAYLHVMDGLGFGFHKLGEAMTLKDFRGVFKGPLMGNCGYTEESAEAAISNGQADMIAFGRPFIGNPDLVERFRNGWPLLESDPSSWYLSGDPAKGYTDFPSYSPSTANA
ncbi:MAG: alkene reductase [Planctomycetota bacterium]|nr:alkene reductase [Planctomycetota bacterium]